MGGIGEYGGFGGYDGKVRERYGENNSATQGKAMMLGCQPHHFPVARLGERQKLVVNF